MGLSILFLHAKNDMILFIDFTIDVREWALLFVWLSSYFKLKTFLSLLSLLVVGIVDVGLLSCSDISCYVLSHC